jgi:DNA-binding protein WhiA
MDSFSKLSKLEIINQQLDSVKSGVPLLFGLFLSCGSYDAEGNVKILTDIKQLYDFVVKCTKNIIKNYKEIFNRQSGNPLNHDDYFKKLLAENKALDSLITIEKDFKINNKNFYKIIFKDPLLFKIFSLYTLSEQSPIIENLARVTTNFDEIRGLAKGMYLGAATSSIKISEKPNEKTSTGYHLEFTSKNLPLLREFSHIIAQFDIYPKLISRKNNYVLYLKDAEHVSDMLALVEANNSVLTLKNEIAKREFRNKINRQTNCLSGNISKTVEASIRQLNAIEKIDRKLGLNNLPPELEEIALLRLANPEEPLITLLQLSDIKLTKSGLNHRLRKIISIADKL